MHWYFAVLYKYAVFDGRSHREELWTFALWDFIIILILMILGAMIGLHWVILILYRLAVAVPGIAVTIRRLHDTGRSGWWYLIGFIPIIGTIVLIIILVQDSQPSFNQYGRNPKAVT